MDSSNEHKCLDKSRSPLLGYFWKVLAASFFTKVAQIFCNYFNCFENSKKDPTFGLLMDK